VIGDYQNPILQPWAAAIVKQHADLERAGFAAPETKQSCWPGGVPNMLSIPSSMELLQTPNEVTILYSNDHQIRFIYLNRPHPAHVTPSWYGDSIGHYEGDTLVVDTVGIAVKRCPWWTCSARRTPMRFMWSNASTCWTAARR